MRVLSFIPAFLLAAASFVAAAPAPSPCASGCGGSSDVTLQPIISILQNTTGALQPLSQQLTSLKGAGCTADEFSGIVVQVTVVVTTCVDQLKAIASIDLTGLSLVDLGAAICDLFGVVLGILNVTFAIIGVLGTAALATIQVVVCDLLNIVTSLVSCLQVYVVGSITVILSPVIAVVTGLVNLLSIVVGVTVDVSL